MDIANKVFGRRVPTEPEVSKNVVEFEPEGGVRENKLGFSTSSKYLFREIELFIPETIGLLISLLASVFLVVFGSLLAMPELLMIAAAPPLVVMILLWMARFLLFMPNKNRFVTVRVLGTNQLRFSVDDIRAEVPFDKSPMSEKVKILNPKKHTDFKTGRPVIVLREGDGENVSIAPPSNTSDQAKELRNVIDSVWGTAEAYTRYNLKKAESQKENLMLLLIIGAILVGLVGAYFGMQNSNLLTELAKVIAPKIISGGA